MRPAYKQIPSACVSRFTKQSMFVAAKSDLHETRNSVRIEAPLRAEIERAAKIIYIHTPLFQTSAA